jgi:hypothetical protein
MLLFMAERLQDENKALDLQLSTMNAAVQHQQSQAEAASLALHQASTQKARSYATLQMLQKTFEAQREQR